MAGGKASTAEVCEGDFDGFFEAPFAAYGPDSLYVTPMRSDLKRYLDPRKNPLMAKGGGELAFFAARRDGRPVGRITAHIHPASNARYGWRRCQFGFFDCADDLEAASALLGAAEAFARARGCDELAGNFNLTAMQQIGVMTEGFENAPYTDMVWGPPHLPRLLEACGYERFFPVSTFEIDVARIPPDALLGERQKAILNSDRWSWRPIARKQFAQRLEEARQCLNDGFYDNPMFVPLTPEEFQFQAGEMMWIVDPRIAAIAARDGEAAGAVVCIPDLNPFIRAVRGLYGLLAPIVFLRERLRRTRAVIIFYSVKRELHSQGLAGAMLQRVTTALRAGGYRTCGVTWIADSNAASLRQVEKLGARRLHRLHLFRKPLG
jgi:GNAT superfamily N-acetyltransferase